MVTAQRSALFKLYSSRAFAVDHVHPEPFLIAGALPVVRDVIRGAAVAEALVDRRNRRVHDELGFIRVCASRYARTSVAR